MGFIQYFDFVKTYTQALSIIVMKHCQWLKSVENLHDTIFMWKFCIWKTPLEILIPRFTLLVSRRLMLNCNEQLRMTLKPSIYLPRIYRVVKVYFLPYHFIVLHSQTHAQISITSYTKHRKINSCFNFKLWGLKQGWYLSHWVGRLNYIFR